MGDGVKECGSQDVLAVGNGYRFKLNDLVDVFVGTGPNIRGTKEIPVRRRFKGVRVVGGSEMLLVRPLVGSQRGPCPAYPPESCFKLKALGSDVFGECHSQFFAKLKPSSQERFPLSLPPSFPRSVPPSPLTFHYTNSELYKRNAKTEKQCKSMTRKLNEHKSKRVAEKAQVVERVRIACERHTSVAVADATVLLASDLKKCIRGVQGLQQRLGKTKVKPSFCAMSAKPSPFFLTACLLLVPCVGAKHYPGT
jgi:hypothetical protein